MPSKNRKDKNNIDKKRDNIFPNSYKEFGICTNKKKFHKKMFELTRVIDALKIYLSKIQGRNLNTEVSIRVQKIKVCVNFLEAELAELKNRV